MRYSIKIQSLLYLQAYQNKNSELFIQISTVISITKIKKSSQQYILNRQMLYQILLILSLTFGKLNSSGSQNLLINGKFMQPLVPNGVPWLILQSAPGWSGNFGFFNGNFFNSGWPSNVQVCQASEPSYQSLVQVFNSRYDSYTLFFQYALPTFRTTSDYYGQSTDVFWNGAFIQRITVWDPQIHNITIQLISNSTTNQLKLVSLAIRSRSDGIAFTNFIMTGYCYLNRNYSEIEQKCIWNPIPNCLKIEQSSGKCIQCQLLFDLYENICKRQVQPIPNCLKIQQSSGKCIQCQLLFYLQGNNCKRQIKSIPNCLKIEQSSGKCIQCQLLFVLYENICKCQQGLYFSQNKCKACLFPCSHCQQSARNCLTCEQNYLLIESQCVIADGMIKIMTSIISFPGFDQLSVGQIFIGSLELFWPYYSHNRSYGKHTNQFLTFIHTVQNNKWVFLSFDKQTDFKFQSLNFSQYGQYSNQKFLQKENRTSYFWDGAFELIIFCFPISLIVFFVLRQIFFLFFNYRISRHFRIYSFFFTIYVLGFEGDLSYLSFLSFHNAINLFSFKFQDKIGHILYMLVFFMLFFYSVGGFFIAKILLKRLAKYYVLHFYFKLQSLYLLSFFSAKALIIGAVNAFLATNYEILIFSLGIIEIVDLLGFTYFQLRFKCCKTKILKYYLILKPILMGIFNFFLWIDWKFGISGAAQADQTTKSLLDFNCKVLIIMIFGLEIFKIVSAYFPDQNKSIVRIKNTNQEYFNKRNCFKQNKQKKKREIKIEQRVQKQNKIKNRPNKKINNNKQTNVKNIQANETKLFNIKNNCTVTNYKYKKQGIRRNRYQNMFITWKVQEDCNFEVIFLKRTNK